MALISQAQCIQLYGNPGTRLKEADPAWVKANIITVRDLPGVPTKWYFQTHKLAVDRFRAGFGAAQKACPSYKVKRAASFVFRHRQHNEHLPLSLHSWGIAVDVDSPENFAHTFSSVANTPKPFSPAWMKVWSTGKPAVYRGLPEAWVRAFCDAAAADWGGDWKGFCDPMHFQLKA